MIRAANDQLRRLGTLASGEDGTVAGVANECWPGKRLADLGFVPGVSLTLVRAGSPCIVRVAGKCLALGVGYQDAICLRDNADEEKA